MSFSKHSEFEKFVKVFKSILPKIKYRHDGSEYSEGAYRFGYKYPENFYDPRLKWLKEQIKELEKIIENE